MHWTRIYRFSIVGTGIVACRDHIAVANPALPLGQANKCNAQHEHSQQDTGMRNRPAKPFEGG
ncbi:hypothetical protein RISK_005404 [Rhodopirellula islandica]|uniref:Uncharacterized protein n=1 Tax=Rhodopirellula islandica TaxID=595434 RepID=A0A0J1B6W9_RHOIS|nr:hypothetical protein RISK_005404 [Rhodopirellula islandica]